MNLKAFILEHQHLIRNFEASSLESSFIDWDLNKKVPESLISLAAFLNDKIGNSVPNIDKVVEEIAQFNKQELTAITCVLISCMHSFFEGFTPEDITSLTENFEAGNMSAIQNKYKGKKALQEKLIQASYFLALCQKSTAINIDVSHNFNFPNINYTTFQEISLLPFIFNIFTHAGLVNKSTIADVILPVSPIDSRLKHKKIWEIRGKYIKPYTNYFPYKKAEKSPKDYNHKIFQAIDLKKNKFYFMRSITAPDGIYASRIARMISKQHFASEHVTDKGYAASTKLPSYAFSVVLDGYIREEIQQNCETEKKVFPGTGIIYEVLQFVNEFDDNPENLGLSSRNLTKAHLSKIDFEWCRLYPQYSRSNKAPKNMLVQIYKSDDFLKDPNFIRESISTRLKLCMLPDTLLIEAAEKCGFYSEETKETSVANAINTRQGCLDHLLDNEKDIVLTFLTTNPDEMTLHAKDLGAYIKKHYPEHTKDMINELQGNVKQMKKLFDQKADSNIELIDSVGKQSNEIKF